MDKQIRVKFIKRHKGWQPGQVVNVPHEDGLNLVDKGIALLTKDMSVEDIWLR